MEVKTRISSHVPGTGRVMATDNDDHPPEAWAQVTAEHVAPINPDMTGQRRKAALMLQLAIADAMEPHHRKVQDTENSKLGASSDQIMVPPNPEEYLDEAIAAIQTASKGTEWEAHFVNPAVVALLRVEIGTHFATVQYNAKSWHADRNPGHPAAKAFNAQHHPGVAAAVEA